MTILLIFISSPLEIVSGEKKTPAKCVISISPGFHETFRPLSSHVNGQELETGRQ